MTDFVTDRRGLEVRVGDTIAYATGDGYLRIGVVLEFSDRIQTLYRYNSDYSQRTPYEKPYVKMKLRVEGSAKPVTIDESRGQYTKVMA